MKIRKSNKNDASRIAEIFIFAKRVAYRPIFCDDAVSFGLMQVLPLALEYQNNEDLLSNIYVYDDEFVKGLVNFKFNEEDSTGEIFELYVDPLLQKQGVGNILFTFAINTLKEKNARKISLWVLEKNITAINFYKKHGFIETQNRKLQEGTSEFIREYILL